MLYLRKSLLGWPADSLEKSEESAAKAGASSKAKSGELRGGKYAARVQTGVEKDGSPKYRYFKTEEEYSSYLKDSKSEGKAPTHGHEKGSGKLEGKVKEEHEESTEKQQRHGLLAGKTDKSKDKSDKDDKPVSKSLRLYVRT